MLKSGMLAACASSRSCKLVPPYTSSSACLARCHKGINTHSGPSDHLRVGLSPSAVNDRLRRLIERGVLRRTRADVDPEAVGLPVAAFVWIALAEGIDEAAFRAAIAENTAVTACHHVTGGWSYLVQIRVASLVAVEEFLVALKRAGWIARTETMLALSTVVEPPFRYRR